MSRVALALTLLLGTASSPVYAIYGANRAVLRYNTGAAAKSASEMTAAEKAAAGAAVAIGVGTGTNPGKLSCSGTLVRTSSLGNKVPAAKNTCEWAVLTAAHCLLDDQRVCFPGSKPATPGRGFRLWLPDKNGPRARGVDRALQAHNLGFQYIVPPQSCDVYGVIPGKNDWAIIVPEAKRCADLNTLSEQKLTPLNACSLAPEELVKHPTLIAGYSHFEPMSEEVSADIKLRSGLERLRCVAPFRDTLATCQPGELHSTTLQASDWKNDPAMNNGDPSFLVGEFPNGKKKAEQGYDRGDSGGLVMFETSAGNFCAGAVMSGVNAAFKDKASAGEALSGSAVLSFPRGQAVAAGEEPAASTPPNPIVVGRPRVRVVPQAPAKKPDRPRVIIIGQPPATSGAD